MTFAVRELEKTCREQNTNLYLLFLDLSKAFDCQRGLVVHLVQSSVSTRGRHHHPQSHNGQASDPFPVSNGVKASVRYYSKKSAGCY